MSVGLRKGPRLENSKNQHKAIGPYYVLSPEKFTLGLGPRFNKQSGTNVTSLTRQIWIVSTLSNTPPSLRNIEENPIQS